MMAKKISRTFRLPKIPVKMDIGGIGACGRREYQGVDFPWMCQMHAYKCMHIHAHILSLEMRLEWV